MNERPGIQSPESQLWVPAPWHMCAVILHSDCSGLLLFNPADLFLGPLHPRAVNRTVASHLFLRIPVKIDLGTLWRIPLPLWFLFLTGIFSVVYLVFPALMLPASPQRVLIADYGLILIWSRVTAEWGSLGEFHAWPVSLWWPRASPANCSWGEEALTLGPSPDICFFGECPFFRHFLSFTWGGGSVSKVCLFLYNCRKLHVERDTLDAYLGLAVGLLSTLLCHFWMVSLFSGV